MKYDKDPTYPSEIFVSELRSKSEWERFPPALSISSFQREYLKKAYLIKFRWFSQTTRIRISKGEESRIMTLIEMAPFKSALSF